MTPNTHQLVGAQGTKVATKGLKFRGGKGASGKEGGGGGGGGYFGGGGGGAGVDASGGGGGSALIDGSFVWVPRRLGAGVIPDAPLPPIIVDVTHRRVTLRWSQPICDVGSEPIAYEIEMAQGSASDDYVVIAETRGDTLSYTHHGLFPSTMYRFRVRGISRTEGAGHASAHALVETSKAPENEWNTVYPLMRNLEGQNGIDRKGMRDPSRVFHRKPKDGWYDFPSPRSGHTASWVSGHMYVFGGMREGRSCDEDLDDSKCKNPALGQACIVDWGTGTNSGNMTQRPTHGISWKRRVAFAPQLA